MTGVKPDAVTAAYVHNGTEVAYSWHMSLTKLLMWDSHHKQRVVRGGFATTKGGTDGLCQARNRIVRDWLSGSDSPWLWWIDTDMGFNPDTIDQLLEVADPVDRPVVGGLCFAYRYDVSDGMNGFLPSVWPVLMDWSETPGNVGFMPRLNYPRDTVTPAAGTGSACILVHRSVFQRLREKHDDPSWSRWYSRLPSPNDPGADLAEDLSFCYRLREAGIPLHVHTGVKTTHMKHVWLHEEGFQQGFAAATEAWAKPAPAETAPQVEAATEPVAVIVPVLRRPQNAKPFMDSLKVTAELAAVYAVCDSDDEQTIAAWKDAGAVTLVDDLVTFPKKVNLGYRETVEPWLFLVGDDVVFHPGWLDQAMHVARQTGADVIGTNDLGNPRVIAGEHATHMLLRRSYVDEVGASWDGPGVVCHEQYRHCFVDDEVVNAAKRRGAFASAKHSVVEHRHPFWESAPDDDVYALGRERFDDDRRLFLNRFEANSQP